MPHGFMLCADFYLNRICSENENEVVPLAWVMAALSLAPSRAGTHAATASAAKPWDPWTQATLTGRPGMAHGKS